MKTIIYGSKDFFNARAIRLVEKALLDCKWSNEITEIVQGRFRGTDVATQQVCKDRWPIVTYTAYLGKHGKNAVRERDHEMVQYADALIAISDGQDDATEWIIEDASRLGKRVFVSNVTKGS